MFYPEISSIWPDGLLPEDYFPSLKNYRHMVLGLVRDVTVKAEDANRVLEALQNNPMVAGKLDRVRMVVITEDWCGDSAVTLPYITALAGAVGVSIRIFRQSVQEDLKKWYVEDGTTHIPVVSILADSGGSEEVTAVPQELFRWVERPAAAQVRVEEWLAEHPQFLKLRARKDEDKAAAKEYFNLYAALLRSMADWYRGGLWPEIAKEFVAGVSS